MNNKKLTLISLALVFVASMVVIGAWRWLSGNAELQDANLLVNVVIAIVMTAIIEVIWMFIKRLVKC